MLFYFYFGIGCFLCQNVIRKHVTLFKLSTIFDVTICLRGNRPMISRELNTPFAYRTRQKSSASRQGAPITHQQTMFCLSTTSVWRDHRLVIKVCRNKLMIGWKWCPLFSVISRLIIYMKWSEYRNRRINDVCGVSNISVWLLCPLPLKKTDKTQTHRQCKHSIKLKYFCLDLIERKRCDCLSFLSVSLHLKLIFDLSSVVHTSVSPFWVSKSNGWMLSQSRWLKKEDYRLLAVGFRPISLDFPWLMSFSFTLSWVRSAHNYRVTRADGSDDWLTPEPLWSNVS